MAKSVQYGLCPRCGHAFSGDRSRKGNGSLNRCPRCGHVIQKWKKDSFLRSKYFIIFISLTIIVAGFVVYLFFTNEGVANEFRQVRQPRPNFFCIGIDVSATIDSGSLDDFKNAAISRLRQFIGDEAVKYDVFTFGNPGCAEKSIRKIVAAKSPESELKFNYEVEQKIQEISVAEVPKQIQVSVPLTTPLHCFLEKILPERAGWRIIIFTDLLNDDSDCRRQFGFPEKEIREYGGNKEGQVIFLYPTPHSGVQYTKPELTERLIDRQDEFMAKFREMSDRGEVRSFFYHIPEAPRKRLKFMESQLQNSIPVTTFDIVLERASKIADTIVSAVRG